MATSASIRGVYAAKKFAKMRLRRSLRVMTLCQIHCSVGEEGNLPPHLTSWTFWVSWTWLSASWLSASISASTRCPGTNYYRAMLRRARVMPQHIVCPSVRLSVCNVQVHQIGWNTSKIISRPNCLIVCTLFDYGVWDWERSGATGTPRN